MFRMSFGKTFHGDELLRRAHIISLIFVCLSGVRLAAAQALPSANVGLFPSVFAGATGTRTGLNGGRNLAITGGVDIGFYAGRTIDYAIEYRGTYPFEKGGEDSQKNNLIGFNLSRRNGRLHPYGDIFYGRGEIDYAGGGAQVPGTFIFYTQSSSNVFAAGGGANFDLGPQFAIKLDALFQRYDTPVTASGHLYPQSATIALVYRIRHRGLTGDRDLNAGRGK